MVAIIETYLEKEDSFMQLVQQVIQLWNGELIFYVDFLLNTIISVHVPRSIILGHDRM